jgi:hypothetical protein
MLLAMDRREDMRAADSDREAVAEQLRSALGEGRLDLHEYDERVQRAYAAKTYAELKELLTDLPETVPPSSAQVVPAADGAAVPQPVTGPDGRHQGGTSHWLAQTWSGYLSVVVVTVAIWGVTSISMGELAYFWPLWVAGPWGAVLLMRTVGGLTHGGPRRPGRERRSRAERRGH